MTVTVRRAWEIWLVQSVHECFSPLHFEKPQALQQLWDMIQCIILCTIPTRKARLARYRASWSTAGRRIYTTPLLPLAWHTRCQRQNDRIKWTRGFCEFCRGRREDHVQRLQQEHQESSQNVRKYVSSGFSGKFQPRELSASWKRFGRTVQSPTFRCCCTTLRLSKKRQNNLWKNARKR